MSEFGSQSYTINGRTVYLKWILTNIDKIVPTYIGNKDITHRACHKFILGKLREARQLYRISPI